jgi:hypothetical protein
MIYNNDGEGDGCVIALLVILGFIATAYLLIHYFG